MALPVLSADVNNILYDYNKYYIYDVIIDIEYIVSSKTVLRP